MTGSADRVRELELRHAYQQGRIDVLRELFGGSADGVVAVGGVRRRGGGGVLGWGIGWGIGVARLTRDVEQLRRTDVPESNDDAGAG